LLDRADRVDPGAGRKLPSSAVTSEIARNFAITRRVADMDRVPKIEILEHGRRVVGIVVHVVAVAALGGSAATATIVSDDPEAMIEEEHHLSVPIVGAQGTAVVEDDRLGLARPPVLKENFDAVFRPDCFHDLAPCGSVWA
jgi:hypothetical protein